MGLTKNDIGLDSLAKAMGEAMDQDIISRMYGHQICPPSSSIPNASNITNVTVAGNTYSVPVDHAIQGKMLKCETNITLLEWETHPAEWVKEKMLRLMLDEMMKEHCIEFTMTKDNHMDMVKVRARVFVTPDDKIRLLRTNGHE